GQNWDCIYDQVDAVKYAYDSGHQIGSHTWAHLDLTTLSWDENHNQFWLVEQAVLRITGAYVGMMRPPYGAYNDLVRAVAANRGQYMITWDFDSLDSDGASAAESKSLYDGLVSSHPSTVLALNHETYQTRSVDVLPHAISVLKGAGYNLVTVAECLGLEPYQWVGEPSTPDDTWYCDWS
ncbi:glycoside hydrolase/deacetylase, partial [Pluteus cervinus]